MKQILLLLLPCFAMAQYTGNANQKITLGEQTTADGLVYRGVANIDTVAATSKITRANKSDTSTFILLDTITNLLWHYKTTSNSWLQAGGSTLDTATIAYVNTYGTQTVNGAKTFTSAITATRFNPSASTATGTGMFLPDANTLGFSTNGTIKIRILSNGNIGIGNDNPVNRLEVKGLNQQDILVETTSAGGFGAGFTAKTPNLSGGFFVDDATLGFAINGGRVISIKTNGNVGIGTAIPDVQFHTTGAVRFAGLASITDLRTDADGDLFNGSDFNLKNSIDSINFGLSDVLKLKPVSFNWNNEARNINEYKSMGFIAQDVMNVIPNAASTMGDGEMQVDYNAIVATLTKAIQEQQALIKALEQRILTLENK